MNNFNFSFSPEWRAERDRLYVLAANDGQDTEGIELATAYRSISFDYNAVQTAYNYRVSSDTISNLETVKEQYLTARRALIEFIKTKHLDFVDPDTE